MYLRAKYTKYKMAKTKFSIWRYVICEICKKNGSNRPFLASRVADTIFPPLIEGHHRQLDNQCRDPMNNNKDCRVGQLTSIIETCKSGSDHSFPDSAASKPPQDFLYQPPSLSSLWMWQKQRLTLTMDKPKCASCCTFLWMRVAIYFNSDFWT